MTIGISKERLIERLKSTPGVSACVIGSLIQECKELDPWLTIESAPKDRRLLLLCNGIQTIGNWYITPEDWDWLSETGMIVAPTHYKLLPGDPL